MVAASMTKASIATPVVVASTAGRAARVAAFAKPINGKNTLFAKSERSFAQAVAGRVATVQVGGLMG